MKPFIQIPSGQHSTLAHWQQILSGNKLESVAAFAYITDSGAAAIQKVPRHDAKIPLVIEFRLRPKPPNGSSKAKKYRE
jgi:hypothetical protein